MGTLPDEAFRSPSRPFDNPELVTIGLCTEVRRIDCLTRCETMMSLNPNSREYDLDSLVPNNPINNTIFRPPLSESDIRPHIMAVKNWAAVKLLAMRPAWVAMIESGRLSSKDLSW